MARKYRRDARGRFAGGGYSGQSGGRGARLKASGTRQGGGAKVKTAKRATPSGAIRSTDVRQARISNAISKNIEQRNKAGLNPPTAAKENKSTRVKRAAGNIASRQPKTGRDIQMAQIRKVQNQKLRDLNRRIKEAGPSAGGLRLEKLKLQDAMRATAPRR
jgi:hypothetical protein